jgi:carboxyl-terminal processing protease
MRPRRAAGIALVAFLIAAAFALGLFLTLRSPGIVSTTRNETADQSPYRVIDEVREALTTSYYRPVSPDVLQRPTIDDVLEQLGDPNTDFLTAVEYDLLKSQTSRSYSGIGLTVEPSRAGLVVTSALVGPAREAGVRRGDLIVRIEGQPAGELTFNQALTLIKGDQGTVVHLTVRRPHGQRLRVTVVRQEIAVPSLRARLVELRGTKIGYIRLVSFPDAAAVRIRQATESLVQKGAKGIVLDLRDNPGGLLTQAVRTVSVFLDEGVVCTVSGLHQEETTYEVIGEAAYPSLPLVVAVNHGSASASEIVAAALQDHERAIVIGHRTYGKASVQSIRPLSGGTALKLTTAMYRTPAGRDLTGEGVYPEVRIVDDPLTGVDEVLRSAELELLELLAAA